MSLNSVPLAVLLNSLNAHSNYIFIDNSDKKDSYFQLSIAQSFIGNIQGNYKEQRHFFMYIFTLLAQRPVPPYCEENSR